MWVDGSKSLCLLLKHPEKLGLWVKNPFLILVFDSQLHLLLYLNVPYCCIQYNFFCLSNCSSETFFSGDPHFSKLSLLPCGVLFVCLFLVFLYLFGSDKLLFSSSGFLPSPPGSWGDTQQHFLAWKPILVAGLLKMALDLRLLLCLWVSFTCELFPCFSAHKYCICWTLIWCLPMKHSLEAGPAHNPMQMGKQARMECSGKT